MKVEILSPAKTIVSNPYSVHGYFAWPTVARLQSGELAVVSSGLRIAHVCPFGKVVMSRSRDEGESWSRPEIILDTPLDDRDGGICTFGDSGVIVSTFNNTPTFQRNYGVNRPHEKYLLSYIDDVEERGDWERFLGSLIVVSRDCGVTWSEPIRVPVSSPHGPCVLPSGEILYIGNAVASEDSAHDGVVCYRITPDGRSEYLSSIVAIKECNGVSADLFCEPHAVALPNGKIIVHIRVQDLHMHNLYTLYQSVSMDGGRSFSAPRRIVDVLDGAPAHLLRHSSGALISVFSHRKPQYGIRAIVSYDEGETWSESVTLTDCLHEDLGYPSTVELKDGSLYTVFYDHEVVHIDRDHTPAVIRAVKWRLAE